MLSTATRWLKAHDDDDHDTIAALRTSDARYYEGPKSLGAPVRNNDEWDIYFPTTKKLFSKYGLTINESFVDEEKCKVIFNLTANAVTTDGIDYNNDYIFILTMTDDGQLVREYWAYVDSLAMARFIKAIGQPDIFTS